MTVTACQELPLAPRDAEWDPEAAERTVRQWAGAEDAPNERYRDAHLWYDEQRPEDFASYHLLIADVVAGDLTAVPRAVMAAGRRVQGGWLDGLSHADQMRVKAHLGQYYARMQVTPPWDVEASRALGVGALTA